MNAVFASSLRCATVLVVWGACAGASGQTPSAPVPSVEEMKRMLGDTIATGRLEVNGTAAFHLRADFETFDYLGKPDGTGTLDAFWDGKEHSRHTITYRDQTRIQIHSSTSNSISGAGFVSSLNQDLLMTALLDPLPNPAVLDKSELNYNTLALGGVAMDCIVVAPTPPANATLRVAINGSTYCVTQGSHVLRVVQTPQHEVILCNELTSYKGKLIPHAITIKQGTILRAKLHVQEISEWTPDDATFVAPVGASEYPSTVRPAGGATGEGIPGRVMAGRILKAPAPEYPPITKARGITGSVVLSARISRTGDIKELEIVSSPDPSLADSALAAVRHWKYSPYLLNDQPVEVVTTITVNFNK